MRKSNKYAIRAGMSVILPDGTLKRAGTILTHDQLCGKDGKLDPGASEYVYPFSERPSESDLDNLDAAKNADAAANHEKTMRRVPVFTAEEIDALNVDELRMMAETHLDVGTASFQPDDGQAVEGVRALLKGITQPAPGADPEDE